MGRLIVVPTPIGNLEDMTLRAIRELREASLILAEDTRHTRKLLSHYNIATRMVSYHEHNRQARLEQVIAALDSGDVALVSDAGMPAISDPGAELIALVAKAGGEIEVLPGASAVTTAVVLSGLSDDGFLFAGFLPRAAKERSRRLEEIAGLMYPIVLYEAPHRLLKTLADLQHALGDRHAVIAREMTKKHEEVVRGSLNELAQKFARAGVRGEFTIVIEGYVEEKVDHTVEAREDMRRRRLEGGDRRSIIQIISQNYGLRRNDAYRMWLEDEPHVE